jgi:hypothetical protein
MVDGEPSERAATTGPSSLSPSSWYCVPACQGRTWKTWGRTYVNLVVLHVAQSQQFVEVDAGGHEGVGANYFLVQALNEGIRVLHGNLLRPDQAMKSAKNHVWGLIKALGLNRDTELVPGSLVLLAKALPPC